MSESPEVVQNVIFGLVCLVAGSLSGYHIFGVKYLKTMNKLYLEMLQKYGLL